MLNNSEMLRVKWNDLKRVISEEFHGVMVAHSGGPDSTALFVQICEILNPEKNFQVGLFHVNYGLRDEESEDDEFFSRDLAKRYGAACHVLQVTKEQRENRQGEGIQEWARRLRYEAFTQFASEGWVIALAHHEDDLAENVLLRLARGAGPGKLAGMREWEKPYWRPLLSQKKAHLAAFLASRGISARTDSSNARLDYSRNIIRHQVLPELEKLYPGAASRIAATAREAEDLASWCEERLHREIGGDEGKLRQLVRTAQNGVVMAATAWWSKRQAITTRLSRRFLETAAARIKSGEPLLGTAPQPTNARRQRQHARGLESATLEVILEPDSHALLRSNDRLWHLGRNDKDNPNSSSLRLETLPLSSTVRFKNQDRSWRLKTLMQTWKIPEEQRLQLKVVYENDEAIGLFWGLFDDSTISRPGLRGEREKIAGLNIDLRTW